MCEVVFKRGNQSRVVALRNHEFVSRTGTRRYDIKYVEASGGLGWGTGENEIEALIEYARSMEVRHEIPV